MKQRVFEVDWYISYNVHKRAAPSPEQHNIGAEPYNPTIPPSLCFGNVYKSIYLIRNHIILSFFCNQHIDIIMLSILSMFE